MKISIIVPVYNVEKYISKCLNSIKNLDIDYEVIIVNDGSTDNSLEIVNEFASKYDGEIKIITKENVGLSSARNIGILNATGSYLFFLDSDDYIDKLLFESFVKEVISDNVDIGFGNYQYLIDGKLKPNSEAVYRKKISKKENGLVNGLTYGNRYFDKAHNFINTEACFLLIKKVFLTDNNIVFKEGIYHEDTLFTLTCLIVAQKVRYYDSPFYIYRKRDDSIINTRDPKIIEKKIRDKLIIAQELFALKEKHQISLTFIDSLIIELLLTSVMHFKTKSADARQIISGCRRLTIKSKIRVFIYRALSLICF